MEVVVFAPGGGRAVLEGAGRVVFLPSVPAPGRREYRVTLGLPVGAVQVLRRFRPQLVHIATPDLAGLWALALARRWRVPVAGSFHTHFPSYLRYYGLGALERPVWWYLRRFYSACGHVYVPSRSMARVLRARGVRRGIRIWGRGVDAARFCPGRRSLEWRRALGIGDGEVVVAWVSRLVREKGLEVFVDVVRGLEARGACYRALVVGDGPARRSVARLVQGLPRAVCTGQLTGQELAVAYASSDVFVFPSETETFGNVTLEAMASGVPAVCARAPGSLDLVEDGRTGFLVAPGDRAGFRDAVARLVEDGELRARMGKAGRARALRREFRWEVVLGRVVSYYRELLDGGGCEGRQGRRGRCGPWDLVHAVRSWL